MGGLKINFQPAGAPVPAGYLADTGDPYGNRGNGYSYGWNAANSSTARDRNSPASPDQRHDTLLHLQKPENPNALWEIGLPNGSYTVRIVSGDPSHIDSVFKMNVEGVLSVDGTPTSTTHWFEATRTVSVSDGKLTIGNAAGAANNKICFVDITQPAAAAARQFAGTTESPVTFEKATASSLALVMSNLKKTQSVRIKLNVPGGLNGASVKDQRVGIDVAGAVMEFVLDAAGRATTSQGRCAVKLNKKTNAASVTITMQGSWLEPWTDAGLSMTRKTALEIPFSVTLGGTTYGGMNALKYNGKTGRAAR